MEEIEILLRKVEASGRSSRLTPRIVQRDFSDLMATLADWRVFQLKTSVEDYCLMCMADDHAVEALEFMAASVSGPQVQLMVGNGCPVRIARFAEEWRPLLVCDIPDALSNQFHITGEVTVDRGRFETWLIQRVRPTQRSSDTVRTMTAEEHVRLLALRQRQQHERIETTLPRSFRERL